MKLKEAERDAILVELVSAVGLQRFRFDTGMAFGQFVSIVNLLVAVLYSFNILLHLFHSFLSGHEQRAQQRADVLRGLHPQLLWLLKVPSNQGRWADLRMVCWSYCSKEQPIHLYTSVAFVWRPSQRSLHQDPIIQTVCCRYYSREPSSPPPSAATTPTLVRTRPILNFTSTPAFEKIY